MTASSYESLGTAYVELRLAIDQAIARLGSSNFARACIHEEAREAFSAMDRIERHYSKLNVPFSELFHASASRIESVAAIIRRSFNAPEIGITYAAEIAASSVCASHDPACAARLVLRDLLLCFETDQGSVVLAQAYKDTLRSSRSPKAERWIVDAHKSASFFTEDFGTDKPSVSTVYVNSHDSAVKSLLRFASSFAGLQLQPVQAVQPDPQEATIQACATEMEAS